MLGSSRMRTNGDIQHAAAASRHIPYGAAIRNANQLGNTRNSQAGTTTPIRIVRPGPSEPCAQAPTDAPMLRSTVPQTTVQTSSRSAANRPARESRGGDDARARTGSAAPASS